jgi:GDP-mannose 6-dehydrogenase
MNVAIFGLGYVGCVSAACLARNGHAVIGVDVNGDKVAMIQAGRSPIVEPGLGDLLADVVGRGALRATTSVEDAVAVTDVGLICVGTPSRANGQPSFDAVKRIGRSVGAALAGRADPYRVVLRSTALPGTTEGILHRAITEGAGGAVDVSVAVNPEFMREGASIHDFDHPPMVLIGAGDARAAAVVADLYAGIEAPVVTTEIRTAELVKYASNAFHALKICFANEMASIAGALGSDAREVMRIFALDRKLNVSDAYLKPGFAFGGSCLPKDVRALVWAGRAADLETPVLSAILPSNQHQIREAIETVLALGRRRIGVLGLAFKPGTDDLRESPVVALVETLIGKGLDVRIFDRNVALARLVGANRVYIETEIPHIASLMCDSTDALSRHADAIIVAAQTEDASRLLDAIDPSCVVIDLTRTRTDALIGDGRATEEAEPWLARASQLG